MMIPMNAAGQQAFDIFYRVAKRLYEAAQDAVDEYIAENFRGAQTTGETHADGRYQRQVLTAQGESRTISYDYRTKEVT